MARNGSRQVLASGLSIFAGCMLVTVGLFSALDGFSAIVKDPLFAQVGDYAYKLDVTTWGWINLVLGLVLLSAGLGVLSGAPTWSRVVGIAAAVLSAVANFLSIPYYPLWALVLIALDVAVIWALSVWQVHSED